VLSHRLTLGPILIAALIGLIWLDEFLAGMEGPSWASAVLTPSGMLPPGLLLLVAAIGAALLASREVRRMLEACGVTARPIMTASAALLGLASVVAIPPGLRGGQASLLTATCAVATLLLAMRLYSRGQTIQGVIAATAGALFSFIYIGTLLGVLFAIRRDFGAWTLLLVVLVTKSCDIGAYFTGRLVGRRKLIFWLSPGKTVEGLMGGVVVAAGLAMGLTPLFARAGVEMPVWGTAALGVALALTGQLGDLVASLIKRNAGFKDSSKALPGFGGVLDVIDSPLIAAPAAYWMLATLAT
jgi:phosphatidate cytidylyltransferase